VLVEGWNKGWDGDWFARGDDSASPRRIRTSTSCARRLCEEEGRAPRRSSRNRRQHRHYEKQLGAALDLYAKLGIDAVKTGYVADAAVCRRMAPTGAFISNGTTGRCSRAITCMS
jgi:alpha-glucosidase